MTHVGYRGNAPAMSDLVAGHVPVMLSNPSDAIPQANAGSIRLIAVTSDRRSSQIPDVPTISESGFPQFDVLTWNGLLAPAGTPPEAVNRMAAAVEKAFKDPATRKRLEEMGTQPVGDTPAQFQSFLQAEVTKWGGFVKQSGIKVEQ